MFGEIIFSWPAILIVTFAICLGIAVGLILFDTYVRYQNAKKKPLYQNGINRLQLKEIVDGKYYKFTYEHEGTGHCKLLAMLMQHRSELPNDSIDQSDLDYSFVFLLDEDGSVLKKEDGAYAIAEIDIDETGSMVHEIIQFWKVKDQYSHLSS